MTDYLGRLPRFGGRVNVELDDANYTLDADTESLARTIEFTGALTANRTVTTT
jgi:hypothetical protein